MIIFGYSITEILAFIGGLSIILGFIKLLFEVIPRLSSFKTSVYKSLNSNFKHKSLERRAISSNIEQVVNDSVTHLQRELPLGWISKARIEWVKEEKSEDLTEGELILRICPIDDQDKNLMNGIYYYFSKVLFPAVKQVIPKNPMRAAVLQLSRRTVSKHHPYAIELFEDYYLEPAIQNDTEIAHYLENYQNMDQHGFFTSVFLREIADIAHKIRFSSRRPEIINELNGVVDQITSFIRKISKTRNAPDNLWYRQTNECSYGFLLVAKPVFWRKVNTYVNKANSRFSLGINTLYVLGAEKEKSFVSSVIAAISNQTEYSLVEKFQLYKDYRKESGGICAVFQLKISNNRLGKETQEDEQAKTD